LRFFLGTHSPSFLHRTDVPLFVSRRRLKDRKTFKPATAPWALDSGGFTELGKFGRWSLTATDYAEEVQRYADEIGRLEWAAPQDWMCEPSVREQTGASVERHQHLTVENFLELERLGPHFIPVVQGWELADYVRHVELYDAYNVDLSKERLVGVGSVCRRGDGRDVARILRRLHREGLRLHAFGIKGDALVQAYDVVDSCDSLAWSYRARRAGRKLPGCEHKSPTCTNCLTFALRWRERLLERVTDPTERERLGQMTMEEDLCAA
jgi:hypothetical protein